MKNLPLISICIPVLNEEGCLESLYERLCSLSEKMKDRCNLEFIFSDNHSTDKTWEILSKLSEIDSRVRAIRFTKNIGFQKSILANYMHSSGDALLQIDADMQDPPEMLEIFFDYWIQGYEFIYGIRKKRPENILLRTFRKLGYWIVDKLSDHPIPKGVGDFRLIDRKVLNVMLKVNTATPYLRGLIPSFGFKQIGIPFDRDIRHVGETKFKISHLMSLGLAAIFENSTIPLRMSSYLGAVILFLSFIGMVYFSILRLIYPELPPGFSSIHVLVIFGIGLNAFLLGIIGEYILRIYLVLKSEPIAIIQNSLNFRKEDLVL